MNNKEQKNNWEERFDRMFADNFTVNIEDKVYKNGLLQLNNKQSDYIKTFISQERDKVNI